MITAKDFKKMTITDVEMQFGSEIAKIMVNLNGGTDFKPSVMLRVLSKSIKLILKRESDNLIDMFTDYYENVIEPYSDALNMVTRIKEGLAVPNSLNEELNKVLPLLQKAYEQYTYQIIDSADKVLYIFQRANGFIKSADIAELFNVSKTAICCYKKRYRKRGINVPFLLYLVMVCRIEKRKNKHSIAPFYDVIKRMLEDIKLNCRHLKLRNKIVE